MKRILLILVIVATLILTGCSFKQENEKKYQKKYAEKKDGIILEYTSSVNGGSIEETNNHYYIRVSSDKKISWGSIISGEKGNKQLSEEEYNSIVNIAFSDEFRKLDKDLTDPNVMDGHSTHITIYYEDGTEFTTGGLNPSNTLYNNLKNKLNELTK